MDDLLIRGGDVVDGTGAPARRADVGGAWRPHRRDRARLCRRRRGRSSRRGVTWSRLEFIDVKTHSDFTLPLYPRAESRVHQGITTELVGSCGFTAAPIPPGRLACCRGLSRRDGSCPHVP